MMRFIRNPRTVYKFLLFAGLSLCTPLNGFAQDPSEEQAVIGNTVTYMTDEERAQWEKELGRAKKTITATKTPVERAEEAEQKKRSEITDLTTVEGCQKAINSFLKRSPIAFLPGRFTLAKSELTTINELAAVLKSCQKTNVLVEGYTDDNGQPQANQYLSGERANSVRDLLIKAGIDKKRILAIGYGAENPIAPNDSVENRALNRRIEVKLY